MDPGNWATDLAGGSRFGYRLLWVLLLSNAIALVLQTLSARLGLVTGKTLAEHCRETYSRRVAIALWLFAAGAAPSLLGHRHRVELRPKNDHPDGLLKDPPLLGAR